MVGLNPVAFIGFIVIIAVATAVWDGQANRRIAPQEAPASLARAVRSARRRTTTAIGATLVLLIAGIVTANEFPHLLGMPFAIAPTIAGAGGLLLYAATPPTQEVVEDSVKRVASLEARRPWSFASRGSLTFLGVLTALVISVLIVTGMTSSPDEMGRFRIITFTQETLTTPASPYPGWFYAGPLIAATLVFVIASSLALRRVASTPSLTGAGLEDYDRLWRVTSTRVLTTLIAATLCLQLGGITMFAGMSGFNGAIGHSGLSTERSIATVTYTVGQLAMVVSVVLFTLTIVRAFRLPKDVVGLTNAAHREQVKAQ